MSKTEEALGEFLALAVEAAGPVASLEDVVYQLWGLIAADLEDECSELLGDISHDKMMAIEDEVLAFGTYILERITGYEAETGDSGSREDAHLTDRLITVVIASRWEGLGDSRHSGTRAALVLLEDDLARTIRKAHADYGGCAGVAPGLSSDDDADVWLDLDGQIDRGESALARFSHRIAECVGTPDSDEVLLAAYLGLAGVFSTVGFLGFAASFGGMRIDRR